MKFKLGKHSISFNNRGIMVFVEYSLGHDCSSDVVSLVKCIQTCPLWFSWHVKKHFCFDTSLFGLKFDSNEECYFDV